MMRKRKNNQNQKPITAFLAPKKSFSQNETFEGQTEESLNQNHSDEKDETNNVEANEKIGNDENQENQEKTCQICCQTLNNLCSVQFEPCAHVIVCTDIE